MFSSIAKLPEKNQLTILLNIKTALKNILILYVKFIENSKLYFQIPKD
jgi:hypothetical protein